MTRRRKITALLTYSNSRDISGEQFQIDLGVGITTFTSFRRSSEGRSSFSNVSCDTKFVTTVAHWVEQSI